LGRKDETRASWEHRYYKRVTLLAHTRCWGVLLAFGLQLPAVPPATAAPGQSVPAAATAAAPLPPDVWSAAWTLDINATDDLHLVLGRDVVATAGPTSPIEARAAKTGAFLWRHERTSWDALVAGDAIVVGIAETHAYALDALTGRTRWVSETTGPATQLTVDGGQLLKQSDADELLRELGTGTPIWRMSLPPLPGTRAALGRELVVVAQQDGTVMAFERATGAFRWQAKQASPVLGVTVESPLVYVALQSGTVCALNDRNGRERWCFPLRVPAADSPVIDGDQLRVALLDNSLRALQRMNGAMSPPLSLGARPAAGPWLSGPSLVVPVTTGELVVIDRRTAAVSARLGVPGATSSHVLERAGINDARTAMASLTLAPGGRRRLTVYRTRPGVRWQILPRARVVPGALLKTPLAAPEAP
jgi:outer membrane protein assembly factor BamB